MLDELGKPQDISASSHDLLASEALPNTSRLPLDTIGIFKYGKIKEKVAL